MKVSHPPEDRPWVLYDGQCGFCTRAVERWRTHTGEHVHYEPSSCATTYFSEIPNELLEHTVVLVDTDGQVLTGAQAVFRLWAASGKDRALRWYVQSRLFRHLSEWTYRRIAANRTFISRLQK